MVELAYDVMMIGRQKASVEAPDQAAERLKEMGTQHYQGGKLRLASRCYKRAASLVEVRHHTQVGALSLFYFDGFALVH